MAEYEDGEKGQYENEKDHQYCMRKSWESRNNSEMNSMLGYNDMSDLANVAHPPTKMEGATKNLQEGPKMANPRKNDRSERAGM